MNLNSLDTNEPKRKYQPYASEPGPQGDDEPGRCLELFLVIVMGLAMVGLAVLGAVGAML